jgi:hypothetical protein
LKGKILFENSCFFKWTAVANKDFLILNQNNDIKMYLPDSIKPFPFTEETLNLIKRTVKSYRLVNITGA